MCDQVQRDYLKSIRQCTSGLCKLDMFSVLYQTAHALRSRNPMLFWSEETNSPEDRCLSTTVEASRRITRSQCRGLPSFFALKDFHVRDSDRKYNFLRIWKSRNTMCGVKFAEMWLKDVSRTLCAISLAIRVSYYKPHKRKWILFLMRCWGTHICPVLSKNGL